jgi:hypothetical protein
MLAPCGAVLADSSTDHTATICSGRCWTCCQAGLAVTTAPYCGLPRRPRRRTAVDLTSMSGLNSRGSPCGCRIGTPTCRAGASTPADTLIPAKAPGAEAPRHAQPTRASTRRCTTATIAVRAARAPPLSSRPPCPPAPQFRS